MRPTNHAIVRAVTNDPQVIARFWTSVDRADCADDCWEWRGSRARARHPVFRVRHHAVSSTRLAWYAATGEFPLGGRMRHTCENMYCVRPDHLEWERGRMTEQVLRASSDGYVPVAAIGRPVRTAGNDALVRRAG